MAAESGDAAPAQDGFVLLEMVRCLMGSISLERKCREGNEGGKVAGRLKKENSSMGREDS